MIGNLIYNGISAASLGVYVSGGSTFDAAEADLTSYMVPGRNGDIVIFNGRYKNISVVYPAFVPGGFRAKVQAIRNWMRSARGYRRLEDTYDADHFRLAIGKGVLPFTPAERNIAANVQLEFDCKPQRFLVSGEAEISVSSGATLTNPTLFDALPIISVTNPTAAFSLNVSGAAGDFTIAANAAYSGTVVIDCDALNIYSGASNLNNRFSGEFPVLGPGASVITFSGAGSVKIIPRWWEL